MSVILDALRRARGQAPGRAPAASPPPGIPSVLVARPNSRRNTGGARWPLLAGVIVMAVVVWAGIQFGPRFFQQGTPSPVAAASDVSTPALAQEAAASSLAQMIETITAPPAVAPRAMPDPFESAATESTQRTAASVTAAPDTVAPGTLAPRTAAPRTAAPQSSVPAPAPATTAVDHFALAVRYQRLGDFEQALTHYTSALLADQFNVEARNNLGLLYHERGLATEAIQEFRRAILIDPRYLRARSNLAVVLLSAGRLAEARAELRAALAIDPRNVDLLVNMALVDKADRQPEIARETLIRAVGLQPSHAAAHYNLAILYDEAGELARAQDHYNDFLKYAGPEYGTRLTDVRERLAQIVSR